MRRKPFAFFTISTETGEWIDRQLNWQLGLQVQRVTFADHRSGWCGIKLHIYLVFWYWSFCLVRWRTPPYTPIVIRSLREQITETHGDRWAAYDAKMSDQEAEEAATLDLQHKIVQEGIRRRAPRTNDGEEDV
jgi:hypothetical protein